MLPSRLAVLLCVSLLLQCMHLLFILRWEHGAGAAGRSGTRLGGCDGRCNNAKGAAPRGLGGRAWNGGLARLRNATLSRLLRYDTLGLRPLVRDGMYVLHVVPSRGRYYRLCELSLPLLGQRDGWAWHRNRLRCGRAGLVVGVGQSRAG